MNETIILVQLSLFFSMTWREDKADSMVLGVCFDMMHHERTGLKGFIQAK